MIRDVMIEKRILYVCPSNNKEKCLSFDKRVMRWKDKSGLVFVVFGVCLLFAWFFLAMLVAKNNLNACEYYCTVV
jgi:hypothetical protein